MTKVTPAQGLAKWGTNLNASTAYIKQGVMAVQVAPGVAAAAASARMLAGITQSVTSGAWAAAVGGVSLQSWQNATVNKGIARIPAGVANAQATKLQTFTNLYAAIDTSVASIANLPKGGLQNNINRAVAFMNAMSQNAPKKQGQ